MGFIDCETRRYCTASQTQFATHDIVEVAIAQHELADAPLDVEQVGERVHGLEQERDIRQVQRPWLCRRRRLQVASARAS